MECAGCLSGSDCEGFVAKDGNFNRVKIKSPNYVALQHNVQSSDAKSLDLVRIVMANEHDEVAIYFPSLKEELRRLRALHDQMAREGRNSAEIEEELSRLTRQENPPERPSKAEKQKQKALRKELKQKKKQQKPQ